MNPFTFQTTPNVLFEAGSARKIADLVADLGAKRVLLVTDKGVRGVGLTQDAEAGLAAGPNLPCSRSGRRPALPHCRKGGRPLS